MARPRRSSSLASDRVELGLVNFSLSFVSPELEEEFLTSVLRSKRLTYNIVFWIACLYFLFYLILAVLRGSLTLLALYGTALVWCMVALVVLRMAGAVRRKNRVFVVISAVYALLQGVNLVSGLLEDQSESRYLVMSQLIAVAAIGCIFFLRAVHYVPITVVIMLGFGVGGRFVDKNPNGSAAVALFSTTVILCVYAYFQELGMRHQFLAMRRLQQEHIRVQMGAGSGMAEWLRSRLASRQAGSNAVAPSEGPPQESAEDPPPAGLPRVLVRRVAPSADGATRPKRFSMMIHDSLGEVSPRNSGVSSSSAAPVRPPWEIPASTITWGDSIGRGAFGEVFLCSWRGTRVACKKMLKTENALDDSFVEEVALLSQLRHPNIVLFMGISITEAAELVLVTEFVERGSLSELVHNESIELPLQMRLRMLAQAASGMVYLHRSEPPIYHRDLKTHNLLITGSDDVKIADFGMSAVKSAEINIDTLGTPVYAAPEVVRAEPYVEASDVYSFGIVMGEVLARAVPYKDLLMTLPPMAIAFRACLNDLRPELPSSLSPELAQLIQSAWAADASVRPSFEAIEERLGELSDRFGGMSRQGSLSQLSTTAFNFRASSKRGSTPFLTFTSGSESGRVTMAVGRVLGAMAMLEQHPAKVGPALLAMGAAIKKSVKALNGVVQRLEPARFSVIFESPGQAFAWAAGLHAILASRSWADQLGGIGEAELAPGWTVASGPALSVALHYGSLSGQQAKVLVPTAAGVTSQEGPVDMQHALQLLQSTPGNYVRVSAALQREHAGLELEAFGIELYRQSENVFYQRTRAASVEGLPAALEAFKAVGSEREPAWQLDGGQVAVGDRIGLGTFGECLEAEFKGDKIAVKRVFSQESFEVTTILYQTVCTCRAVQHPCLVDILGCFRQGLQLFIAMERLPGNLEGYVRSGARSRRANRRIAADVARGLAYLHSLKMVHLHVRPPNVLLGDGLAAKLADYETGLLRSRTVSATATRHAAWLPPDLLSTGYADASAWAIDVYSFGLLCWYMATGKPPSGVAGLSSAGDTSQRSHHADTDGMCPLPVDLLQQCLVSDPAKRPAMRDLELTLEVESVQTESRRESRLTAPGAGVVSMPGELE